MKILYIGVHTKEEWRSEFWITKAFINAGHEIIKYDYKTNRKRLKTWKKIGLEIQKLEVEEKPAIIFLQRGKKIPSKAFRYVKKPIFFWSTEPINLKNDVDQLLKSKIFKWVFVHTYSCLERIKNEFPHLEEHSSVMHNACPKEYVKIPKNKTTFCIFNRNLSIRRKNWLEPSIKIIKIINGKFGSDYYKDLQNSNIAINIHFSDKNVDDFETGIFEAMASGCVIISERLNSKTLADLKLKDVIIQVESPKELVSTLQSLKSNPQLVNSFQVKSQNAIKKHTWDNRVDLFVKKFNEYI